MATAAPRAASIWKAGLKGRCPACGQGRLFAGFLTLAPGCEHCGLDYGHFDSGDGPAVFIMLIVGFIVAGLALVVETMFAPPYWVHLALWLPLTIALAVGLLRPFKGVLIALQHRHDAGEGRRRDGG
ncbi:MAG: DUF983 domain-containing protein [Alphaproteobacteria bacterium]|nr:MAG: DUF983 domain-containing protein [Alphaproteobacteria bacterium]